MRRIRASTGVLGAAVCLVTACGGGGSNNGAAFPAVALEPAFDGVAFSNPVKLVQHPTDDDRWYVVEQDGLVQTFLASDPAGTKEIAADVDAEVNLGTANEQGLLGLAFDPGFATSGEIYLAYTDEGAQDGVLARWTSADGGETFEPDTIVLSIPHPRDNHNGGDIMFGADGFLYYSMGDGGGSGDPDRNAQNRNVLLGKILRLDVNSAPPAGKTYAIPPGNPFPAGNPQCDTGSGTAPCPEIFAFGFRNPWRMNFDPATGALYVGDVGESSQEEIDLVVSGGNFGWDCFEGTAPFQNVTACDMETFRLPEASHPRSDARAITGGAVYRGSAIPGLVGFYVYGDFLSQLFFAFDVRVPDAAVLRVTLPPVPVSSFGQGRDGEIYVVGFGTPSIQKIVPGAG